MENFVKNEEKNNFNFSTTRFPFLFNFHTHNLDEKFGIINAELFDSILEDKMYSVGMHPLQYVKNAESEMNYVKQIAQNSHVVMIGEVGLDPNSPVELELQKNIFEQHIEISESTNKPLLIHCVKYYNDLVQLKKKANPKSAWIIHGFRGKISVANELLKHGFWFSINEDILQDTEKTTQLISLVGIDKIFFETDAKHYNIRNIYNFAASVLNVKIDELIHRVKENLEACKITIGKNAHNF